jgi:hypothetical protein
MGPWDILSAADSPEPRDFAYDSSASQLTDRQWIYDYDA